MQTQVTLLDGEIPGAVNFRDLGGIPVAGGRLRQGVVWRSAMTHHIDAAGIEALAVRFGIRTVIDLRNATEIAEDGVADFAGAGIEHRHVPIVAVEESQETRALRLREMWGSPEAHGQRYAEMALANGAAFGAVLGALTEGEGIPAVFHCSAGRGRTGVAAALLLSALGADDDAVAADYARTGELLRPHAVRFAAHADRHGMSEEEMVSFVVSTEPQAIRTFLALLNEAHGSVHGYLDAAGVDAGMRDALRERLVG